MTLALYGHPFASFVWKPLIALYERDVRFEFRMVDPDHPENQARMTDLSPTGQFPALIDGDREITESNAVIEYLDLFHGNETPMVPEDPREALGARMMADVFDDYVHAPMQRIVGNALRGENERDPRGVADARTLLDRCYAWLEPRLQAREWAACGRFTIADCAAAPALFYADWVHPIPERHAALAAFRARLLSRSSVARVVDEARPYRSFFPLGAPDRD
ncbi:glutathione S-transferase family protein [Sinorhizobium alkalisoli]|uniref:Glutathione S-transferase n=1 Tax=Sinorhizobium alkalisoli TaxID=1752398 RepID=A0A1E3VC90_9HYPH|nr:glutathione S-transferase family protein [Sinorhizobium alkalisoli]MCA1494145.1 glutathione S-transferase family protein [Ensifer sp. NBAIM29]MCG5479113.1 glutathione S-transferase family protein [Sinorhizobium alkalisoli]ODR91165.1 glutathione S-transferase [Sinorhizobium alkalisoli]QFI66777.1 Glutathione S-transferase, N-terminal domain [Sinorhizobium alkalisoli]